MYCKLHVKFYSISEIRNNRVLLVNVNGLLDKS